MVTTGARTRLVNIYQYLTMYFNMYYNRLDAAAYVHCVVTHLYDQESWKCKTPKADHFQIS